MTEEDRWGEGRESGGETGVLCFRVPRKADTVGGDGWRQKLGGPWGCGRFTFSVYAERVQECEGNQAVGAMWGEVGGRRGGDGGLG